MLVKKARGFWRRIEEAYRIRRRGLNDAAARTNTQFAPDQSAAATQPSVLMDYFDRTLTSPRLRHILEQAKADAGRARPG